MAAQAKAVHSVASVDGFIFGDFRLVSASDVFPLHFRAVCPPMDTWSS